MGAAEWREADDLCSRAALLDSLNVAPTPSTVACLAIACTKDDAKTCQHEFMEGILDMNVGTPSCFV